MKLISLKSTRMTILTAVFLTAASSTACLPGKTMDDSSSSSATGIGAEVNYLAQIQTAPDLRIRDLPIPAGFLYKPDKSMIIEYGNVQAGIIIYEGTAEAGELVGYYRREMTKYDWTLVSMIERDDVRMMFNKTGRICEVTLRASSGLSRRTTISVYYAPKEG